MEEQVNRYLYTNDDEHGHACLEDERGNALCVQPEWLPDGALPGAIILVRTHRRPDAVTYQLTIDLSGVHNGMMPPESTNGDEEPNNTRALI